MKKTDEKKHGRKTQGAISFCSLTTWQTLHGILTALQIWIRLIMRIHPRCLTNHTTRMEMKQISIYAGLHDVNLILDFGHEPLNDNTQNTIEAKSTICPTKWNMP